MKRYSSLAFAIATACILTGSVSMAQDTKGSKGEKGEKGEKGSKGEKDSDKLKQYEELIIRKKTDNDGKVTIEIKDGDVIVNGQPLKDYESEDLSIRRGKSATITVSPFRSHGGGQMYELDKLNNNKERLKLLGSRAFLGVVTEEAPGGARIVSVSKGTAAEKSGLKEKDIITKIDGEKVQDENDVSRLIRSHKPKDKVKIDILRDGKEQSVTAELGENKDTQSFGFSMPENFNLEDLDVQGFQAPRVFEFSPGSPAAPAPYGFNYFGRPKLGIKAQDTEEGKGVKVLDVEHESAAEKSGIKEDDIITEFNDKKVNSADELAAEANAAREKSKIPVKLLRNGKSMSLEISIPKKLKTANL